MNFDEYMTRFRLLQHGAEQDEKMLKLLRGKAYQSFAARFGKTENPVLRSLLLTEERVEARRRKRQKLCERYGERIARAAALIESPPLREYALYHYLYGLTHEEIAEQSFFSVRTVYRHGKAARRELEKALLSLMPKAKRTKGARYRIGGTLPRKTKSGDKITRSVAFSTARRKSLPYRPVPACI